MFRKVLKFNLWYWFLTQDNVSTNAIKCFSKHRYVNVTKVLIPFLKSIEYIKYTFKTEQIGRKWFKVTRDVYHYHAEY